MDTDNFIIRNTKYDFYNPTESIESILDRVKEDLQSYMQTPFEKRVNDRFTSMQAWCTYDTMSSIEDLRRYEKNSDENFNRIINQTPEEYYLSDRPVKCAITGDIIPYGEDYYIPVKGYTEKTIVFSQKGINIILKEFGE